MPGEAQRARPEQEVLRFLAAHQPGHMFNVTECSTWLIGRFPTREQLREWPTGETLRKYIRKHAESVGRGQYRVKPVPSGAEKESQ